MDIVPTPHENLEGWWHYDAPGVPASDELRQEILGALSDHPDVRDVQIKPTDDGHLEVLAAGHSWTRTGTLNAVVCGTIEEASIRTGAATG